MAYTFSCSIVGFRLDYCNALLHGMTHKHVDSLQRVHNWYKTHLTDSSAMSHTVVHLSPYVNCWIGYQSSNALSTNYDVQNPTTPAAVLPAPSRQSVSTCSLSSYVKLYSAYGCFHQPKLLPLLVLSAQLYGTVCRLLLGNHRYITNFCVTKVN